MKLDTKEFETNKIAKRKNYGFSFTNYNAHEMMDIIDYALRVYEDKEAWAGLVDRAMSAVLDWDKSADAYLKVFNSLLD